ncbi:MAG TPA: NADPH-dependent assimilatory sulfite reductase hemoprotein subunit [Ktedonobacteraceae bacterium]|jgi:sulfite reductase (ferredoxin)|nr:NADPH-dependent assimilatory sulfite reductase hemoprotein subunit [Ktedonobacteraceae bacterium]
MPTPEQNAPDLITLGQGEGSKVEKIKINSRHLRGQLAEELEQNTSRFSEDQIQLLKFHGSYQQEDRDLRQARKAAGEEKAYQFMIRSRIPGGVLTAAQYLAQDDIASNYGNGTLRITTRQSIQLHGVLKSNLRATIHDINQSLISTLAACGDVNRNVMACPAPSASRAHAQLEEIAHAIAMHLAPKTSGYHEIWIDGEKQDLDAAPEEEPIYGDTYLPRKFKIGVAFPGDNCIDIYTQDIGLIARVQNDDLVGFTVVIGGGMGMTHGKPDTFPLLAKPFCDIGVDEVLQLAETIVTVQRDYGDRKNRKHARMKYVVEERGIPWFRAEVERRLGRSLAAPSPVEMHDVDDHLGWHEQADGRWFLGLHVENGRVRDTESQRLRSGLRRVLEQFAPGVRLTAQQDILLCDISAEQRSALEALLHDYGIETDPQSIGAYRFAMACPALPTCGQAVAEAERVHPDVVRQIEADLHELGLAGERISIRMTGCPNGCARPYMGDIGFVGRTKDIYNIYVGGDMQNTRLNTLYAASVRLSDLAHTLRPLLTLWKEEREGSEFFGDYCQRIGIEALQAKVASLTSSIAQ